MQALKKRSYTPGASDEEREKYVRASEEVARLTLSNQLVLRVAIAFGRGREFQLVQAVQEKCREASRLIRNTREDGCEPSLAEAHALMTGVDPLKAELLDRLLEGASLSPILPSLRRKPKARHGAVTVRGAA